jgi:carbonic anhydrase
MPKQLIEGLRRFRKEHFPRYRDHYVRLVEEGQRPSTLFIGCSDSRVVPELLTDSLPGELFILRNVGNLVPPFELSGGFHGVAAGIEFATTVLEVTDIVVCGHSHCAAIRSLYEPLEPATPHVRKWLELAQPAHLPGHFDETLLRKTEKRSIALQLENLLTFPMVRARSESGALGLHGWHYILEEGRIDVLDINSGEFVPLDGGPER